MPQETIKDRPITASGVRRAALRIADHIIRTPLIENDFLNDAAGGRVLVKAEVLQHCGSFKARGAYNLISQLSADERKRGVLAWSSGNHAQGVARAARHFGAPATIIMPTDTPKLKIEKVRTMGAEIIFYDRYTEDREEIAKPIQRERAMVLAPSYDHPDIIEGQGTLALETIDEVHARGLALDAFIACCGGGGLTSGCATLLEEASPETAVWIAEPEGFDETWASIQSGERQRADVTKRTICDAIATPTPGRLTLPIMQRLVRGGVSLTEDEVGQAMVFAYKYLKLVVEPGGAVALAAILTGKFNAAGKTTAITLSGGNVDPSLFADILQRHGG
ncbi:MAG: threonine/serine dehydratase [Alphaproteobacteria bacterium]|nr:threonine/serine dehydratase [Alphaproteobacteria bacterium]